MKTNTVEKYFKQKKWSILEIVCVIAAVAFGFLATFVNDGGPIGLSGFGISIAILIFSKSTKISDTDIDTIIDKLVNDNMDISKSKNLIRVFDLRGKYHIKGKDGKIRSTNYVISTFLFNRDDTHITMYNFDLLSGTTNKEIYVIPIEEKVLFTEDTMQLGGIPQKMQYIECSAVLMKIPIRTDEIDAYKIVERLCK